MSRDQEYKDEPIIDTTDHDSPRADAAYDTERQERSDRARAKAQHTTLLNPHQQHLVRQLVDGQLKIQNVITAQQALTDYMPGVYTQQAMSNLQGLKNKCYEERNELLKMLGMVL